MSYHRPAGDPLPPDAPTPDGEPRYSWIVRDGDDEPWILLGYRWTDRKAALETAGHWRNCGHHGYALVETVEVFGDAWRPIS